MPSEIRVLMSGERGTSGSGHVRAITSLFLKSIASTTSYAQRLIPVLSTSVHIRTPFVGAKLAVGSLELRLKLRSEVPGNISQSIESGVLKTAKFPSGQRLYVLIDSKISGARAVLVGIAVDVDAIVIDAVVCSVDNAEPEAEESAEESLGGESLAVKELEDAEIDD